MPWLVADDGRVLASIETADSFAARVKGLLGRDGIDGALVIPKARSVHTLGMRFTIDVAFCDADMRVLRMVTMRPQRISRPTRGARVVIEAEAGMFERWRLAVGDRLEVRA